MGTSSSSSVDGSGGYDYMNWGYDIWFNQNDIHTIDSINGAYTTDLLYNRTKYIISNHNPDEPLLLYLPFETVHTPIQHPPKNSLECSNKGFNEDRERYCNQILYLDEKIGEIKLLYEEYGLWDNTILLFSTDNGGMPHWSAGYPDFDDCGVIGQFICDALNEITDFMYDAISSFGCNLPYRGGKGTLFQGGIKGIGFINGGNNYIDSNLRGSQFNSTMHVIDFLPTIIEGILDDDQGLNDITDIDGINMWNSLINNEYILRPEPLFIDIRDPTDSIGNYSGLIDGNLKFFQGKQLYDPYFPCNGSYVENIEAGSTFEWLFDLNIDPFEYNNIAEDNPELVSEYKAIIDDFIQNGGYMEEQGNYIDENALPKNNNGVWTPWLDDVGESEISISNIGLYLFIY